MRKSQLLSLNVGLLKMNSVSSGFHFLLCAEVQYAQDTSTSLAKVNPLFRIRTQKIGDERARQLTCAEFATNIKKLISQKLGAVDKMITLQRFMSSLNT